MYFSRSEKSTKFYIKKKEIPQWIFQCNKLEWIQLNPVSIQKKVPLFTVQNGIKRYSVLTEQQPILPTRTYEEVI